MRQYLAWETGLIAQLDEQDKALFKVGASREYATEIEIARFLSRSAG